MPNWRKILVPYWSSQDSGSVLAGGYRLSDGCTDLAHIPWESTAHIVQYGCGRRHSGSLSSCLLYWRDEMSDVTKVTSFIVVDKPIAGKLRLEPEDLLQLVSGNLPPELQSAY